MFVTLLNGCIVFNDKDPAHGNSRVSWKNLPSKRMTPSGGCQKKRPPTASGRRGVELDLREVGSVPLCVASEHAKLLYLRVGADVEIRKW